MDLPAVVVRARNRDHPLTLINLPQSEAGAELVLYLISAHPDASAITTEHTFVRFADITRVDCPRRGALLIEEDKEASPEPVGSFRPIEVRIGTRSDEFVGIANIPGCERGRALLREILATPRQDDLHAYTLFTTDYGHIPLRELAEANRSFL